MAILLIGYAAVRNRERIGATGNNIGGAVSGNAGLRIFRIVQYILGITGVVVLYATVFPGLTPFAGRVNQNLGLGGLSFFFIWPLLVLQIVLSFVSWQALVRRKPLVAWMLLIALAWIAIQIDIGAIRTGFN